MLTPFISNPSWLLIFVIIASLLVEKYYVSRVSIIVNTVSITIALQGVGVSLGFIQISYIYIGLVFLVIAFLSLLFQIKLPGGYYDVSKIFYNSATAALICLVASFWSSLAIEWWAITLMIFIGFITRLIFSYY